MDDDGALKAERGRTARQGESVSLLCGRAQTPCRRYDRVVPIAVPLPICRGRDEPLGPPDAELQKASSLRASRSYPVLAPDAWLASRRVQ
jgi:hypothetical protein